MLPILTGPILSICLLIFVVGMLAKLVCYFRGLSWQVDRVAYKKQWKRGLPGALSSIGLWLLPWGTRGWRAQPFLTTAFVLLHVGAVTLPLFLVGHTIMLQNATGISLPSFHMTLADIFSIAALVGIVLLAVRRVIVPEARALSTWQDWFLLALMLAIFLSGFVSRLAHSELWTIIHVISGLVFLVIAPFTKLSHMVLFFASRAQIGMDFAIKRGGASRGPAFPW